MRDRPRVKFQKTKEKDPWGMKAKPKKGRVVLSRAIKFPDRDD